MSVLDLSQRLGVYLGGETYRRGSGMAPLNPPRRMIACDYPCADSNSERNCLKALLENSDPRMLGEVCMGGSLARGAFDIDLPL